MTIPLPTSDMQLDEESPKLPQKAVFVELGTGGLRKSGGYIDADFLPELNGLTGAKKYIEMSSNDPVLSSLVFALTMLLRNAKWRIEPADTSDAAVAARDLLEEELFEKMESSWADVIAEVATMFIHGYAPLEVVYIKREEGHLGVRKLALRLQETVYKWAYDADRRELTGLWQMDYEHPMVFIPLQKLMLFRTTAAGGTPEGRSLLRGSYVSWVRKKAIEEAEGRASMRAAGVVVVRIPGSFMVGAASPEEKVVFSSYKAIAERLAQDRQGAMVLPSDVHAETKLPLYSLEYVVADGRRSNDMSPIIERIDKRMASTVLADFILLGQQAVGSFALSSDKTDLFATALGGWMKMIVDTFNRQLVKPLWELNGFPDETLPKVAVGDVEDRSLAELGTYLKDLSAAGMPLFPNPELEDYALEAANLPEMSDDTRERLLEQVAAQHEAEVAGAAGTVAEAAATKATAGATVRHRGMPLPKPPTDGRPAKPARGRLAKSLLPFYQAVRDVVQKFNPSHYGPGAKGGQFAPKGGLSMMTDFSPENEAADVARLDKERVRHIAPYPDNSEHEPSKGEVKAYQREVRSTVRKVFGTEAAYEDYVREITDKMPGYHFEVHTNLGEQNQLLMQMRGAKIGQNLPDENVFSDDGDNGADVRIERQFIRNKAGELVVHHDNFHLAHAMQGQGVGSAVTRSSFELYKRLGVTRVDVFANADVGGYAWARMGFVPKPRDWANLADRLDGGESGPHRGMTNLGLTSQRAIRQLLRPDGRLLTGDPKTIWKIADARSSHSTPPYDHIGKQVLKGENWHGSFDMHDSEAWSRMMDSTAPGKTRSRS